MINEIFYTFSTIAQALAGAIALLGAFVLFRLQSLNAEIDALAERLSFPLQSVIGEEANVLYRKGQFRELLDRFAGVMIPQGTYRAELERERLPHLLDGKDSFLLRFKVAFYLTLSLIMFAVTVLIFAEPLVASAWCARIAFGIGLTWLGACLVSYIALMHQSLK